LDLRKEANLPERMSFANYLTIFRILLIPFFIWAYCLYGGGNLNFRRVALALFIAGVITDLADGYFARFFRQKTQLGSILDPIADKMLLISAFLCLSLIQTPAQIKLPLGAAIIFITRDALIILGSGMIQLFVGSFRISPTRLGKFTTFLQMFCVICVLLQLSFAPVVWNFAVAFTIISGIDYLRIGTKLLSGTYPA
jgi:CDP-diacylglycerol--glycerol-3-phosphate 3-phosphatidyltransferase